MTTPLKAPDSVQEEVARLSSKALKLSKLLDLYPDLKRYVGRWEKVVYYSPSVNSKANKFDLHHNCGCCPDSPLELWSYIETPEGKVYSDPPSFTVGEKHWVGGDKPYQNWKQKLEEAGIPTAIIEAVSEHFRKCKEARIAAASEDDVVIEDPEPLV